MRVENSGDLINWTYFMIDWSKVTQEESNIRCADCGGLMKRTEPVVDSKGASFDGYVCHADKRVVWVKSA